ncbi:tRNA pseudouridine(38-40) synthase TruA [Candidatus Neomarinimicrobiota bacterium]
MLLIEYDGTAFHGWQTQRKGRTVQSEIEGAIQHITGQSKVNLIGSGRTDTGVHARGQVANVRLASKLAPERLRCAINSQLAEDVRIQEVKVVPFDFHARKSARRRRYRYSISQGSPVLGRDYIWCLKHSINHDMLKECAKYVRGTHDFVGFSKANADVNSTVCRVNSSRWEFTKNRVVYHISANRFLHHMVRYLVGTMVEVARSRYTLKQFRSQLVERGGALTVYRAPAQGLVLDEVLYPSASTQIQKNSPGNRMIDSHFNLPEHS